MPPDPGARSRTARHGHPPQWVKVFWFFFSKKNKAFFFEKKKQKTFILLLTCGAL